MFFWLTALITLTANANCVFLSEIDSPFNKEVCELHLVSTKTIAIKTDKIFGRL